MVRKGLGKGRGKGYKNLQGRDPKIHSDSSKGRKQPQKIQHFKYGDKPLSQPKPKPMPKLSDEDQEIVDRYSNEALKEIRESIGEEDIQNIRDEDKSIIIEMEDGREFQIYDSVEDAEREAEDRVREDLEDSPENFTQSWLENYMTIYDTDRRMLAGEESDNLVDEVYDESEILEKAEVEDEYEEIQEKINEKEDKVSDMEEKGQDDVLIEETEKKKEELENKSEELVEKAKEQIREEEYDRIYDELEDPVQYFVEDSGMYSREDLLKANFISIDIEKATEDALSTDGYAHFLNTYDGDATELNSGQVLMRMN